jgi:hypothetical protein
MSKKNPLNMERDGSPLKSKHFFPCIAKMHEIEPEVMKSMGGKSYSSKALREGWKYSKQQYPGHTTSLQSFSQYMNIVSNPAANRGRWLKTPSIKRDILFTRHFLRKTF